MTLNWKLLYHYRGTKDCQSRLLILALKCLYGQQSFYSCGSSIMRKKVFYEKILDYDILTP